MIYSHNVKYSLYLHLMLADEVLYHQTATFEADDRFWARLKAVFFFFENLSPKFNFH